MIRRASMAWLLLLAASCGEDPGVFGDAQWQLRCPDGFAGCSRAGTAVDVFDFHGNGGIIATCNVASASADERIVNFSVGIGNGAQRLSVDGLLTGAQGGAVRGASCITTIIDDSNTYGGRGFGTCGGGVPGDQQPCQIGNLTIDEDGTDGPEITMTILCRRISAAAAPDTLKRDLVAPDMPNGPATVRLINCPGI